MAKQYRAGKYSIRSIEIKLKTIGNAPNINIMNTYTPDMRYDEETHNKQRAEIREILKQIPTKNVICRRADNNGKPTQEKKTPNIQGNGQWGTKQKKATENNQHKYVKNMN